MTEDIKARLILLITILAGIGACLAVAMAVQSWG
jgi:hypothetical protein